MPDHVDLEIGLRWDRPSEAIRTYLRIDRKGTTMDEWDQPEDPVPIDIDRLLDLDADTPEYGAALGEMLLWPADIGKMYNAARKSTEAADATLHIRLHINAPAKYHAIRWETIRDPDSGHRIATESGVLFSRYLSSAHWRSVPTRPKHALKGLVVVSAPTNIHEWSGGALAPVDRDAEVARAEAALSALSEVTVLSRGEAALAPIMSAMEDGVDVLYLVCHGHLTDDDAPQLYLEKPDGTTVVVDGRTLVERLTELEHRPTIVMLCSCQSASRGDELWTADDGELAALGPRLSAAGVAAVVAMQGDFSMESAEIFGPKFFQDLSEHGQVDRAVAAARRAIQEHDDWWVPVLFSRLRSGRTYYKPGFDDRADEWWMALQTAMGVEKLTPVLGPGLSDAIVTSREEMAARWVERWQMPLAAHTQGDLAQVAQFLRVRNADGTVRNQLLHHLNTELTRKRDAAKQGDPFWGLELKPSNLEPAILEAGKRLREANAKDPYRVAAALPVRVFVTTGWTDLLQEALRAKGKRPVTMKFHWNKAIDPPADGGEPDPTEDEPLVYHLFGHLEDVDSLVLSEDDYFQWFTAWLQKGKNVPEVVKTALISRSLLLLGFHLDDWDFRVVFHAIKSIGGSALLPKNEHVGVQISPETPLIEPEAAQEYLESYFGPDKVHIYWGEPRDFLRELANRTGLET